MPKQSVLEGVLVQLPDEDIKHFNKLCRYNAHFGDIQAWLKEKGHEVSIANISQWHKIYRPRGKEAVIINEMMAQWEGISPNAMIHLSAGICSSLAVTINKSLQTELSKASATAKLASLVELLKELRQIGVEMQTIEVSKSETDSYQAGVINMAEEIEKVFKGTHFEDAIHNAVKAAIVKLIK